MHSNIYTLLVTEIVCTTQLREPLEVVNNPRESGGRLLVSCVPVREQKENDEKGYFFSSSAVRSAVIVQGRKNAIYGGGGGGGNGMFLQI